MEHGFGSERDLAFTEAGGRLDGADPGRVSDRAITRGSDQCGTLGSGNHFLEVQVVDRIHDQDAADVMGLREGQITVLDPFGLARAGLPGLRRLPGDVQERPQEVWLRAARLAARLCPGAQSGGAGVPGRHARGGQLRLVQPPAPDPPGARGLRRGLRQALGEAGHGPGLRRRPQHRQVRGPRRRRRQIEAGLRPPQGRHAGVPAGPSRDSAGLRGDRPAGHHSREHGNGKLGARRASPAAWSIRSARPATARAG